MFGPGFVVHDKGQAQCRHSLEQLAHTEFDMFLVCLQPLHHFLGALVGGLTRRWPSKRPLHHEHVQLFPCVSHTGVSEVARALGFGFILSANLAGALLARMPVPELCCCPLVLRSRAWLNSAWDGNHRSKVAGA